MYYNIIKAIVLRCSKNSYIDIVSLYDAILVRLYTSTYQNTLSV